MSITNGPSVEDDESTCLAAIALAIEAAKTARQICVNAEESRRRRKQKGDAATADYYGRAAMLASEAIGKLNQADVEAHLAD